MVEAEEVSRRWDEKVEEADGPIGLFSCSALALALALRVPISFSLESKSNGDPGLVDLEIGRVLARRLASKERVEANTDCLDCWGVFADVAVREGGIEMACGAGIGDIARPMIWTV
jgi:hypothetical protein